MTTWLDLLFPDCEITDISLNAGTIIIKARHTRKTAICPQCEYASGRVHSYYRRHPQDLPMSCYFVCLHLSVRRFRCLNQNCKQQTFSERWGEWLAPYAQKTTRIKETLYHIAQVAGGKGGERLLTHLKMKASGTSLIRLIRNYPEKEINAPQVIGVDDWAFRKGLSYGTILVDLEQQQVIDLLAGREADVLANWLKAHPTVQVVARDRSKEYAKGISLGSPSAQQVADRWHLLLNMRQMLERYVRQVYNRLTQLPTLPSSALAPAHIRRGTFVRSRQGRIASQESRDRRYQLYEDIQRRKAVGESILGISKTLSLHRETVRTFYYAEQFPERSKRQPMPSLLDNYVFHLEQRWAEGCENAKELWREICVLGYSGSYGAVNKWLRVRRRRPAPETSRKHLPTALSLIADTPTTNAKAFPSAKTLAYILNNKSYHPQKETAFKSFYRTMKLLNFTRWYSNTNK